MKEMELVKIISDAFSEAIGSVLEKFFSMMLGGVMNKKSAIARKLIRTFAMAYLGVMVGIAVYNAIRTIGRKAAEKDLDKKLNEMMAKI